MPLDIEFAKPDRFEIRVSGEVTLQEIERAIEELMTHPGVPGSDALVDCTEVEKVPTATELRAVARDIKPVIERGFGAACVVARNPFIYGTARMFGVFAEAVGANIGAETNMEDARVWLAQRRGTTPGST